MLQGLDASELMSYWNGKARCGGVRPAVVINQIYLCRKKPIPAEYHKKTYNISEFVIYSSDYKRNGLILELISDLHEQIISNHQCPTSCAMSYI